MPLFSHPIFGFPNIFDTSTPVIGIISLENRKGLLLNSLLLIQFPVGVIFFFKLTVLLLWCNQPDETSTRVTLEKMINR